jgi:hypothetical protein
VPHDRFDCGKIQELGVEVEHIPVRCIGLCQAVDVDVNKPFKELNLQTMGILDGSIRHCAWNHKSSIKQRYCQMIIAAMQTLPEQVLEIHGDMVNTVGFQLFEVYNTNSNDH